jgi:peptidoglycan/LPS O-acetylase OafA/YrhL
LRAIAVLSVLFYHAHLSCPGGYVGVDVFFVISGFLITSLLVRSMRSGTFSYLSFWERRARRLMPALAVTTLATAVTSAFILVPQDLSDLGGALIAQPLLLSNVYFLNTVTLGYFGDPPETRPLLHTWSLGVEEQFYVIYPMALALLFSARPLVRHVGKALALLGLASLAASVLMTANHSVFTFFTLPPRAWELLLGAVLVFLPPLATSRPLRELLSWTGLAAIGYAIFAFDESTPFPGSAALVPCLGTAMLIFANGHAPLTWAGRLLAQPAMVRIGQISYSLYLWHWPLVAYGDYAGLLISVEARLTVVLLSCWLGYLSWQFVETPAREKRVLGSGRSVLLFFVGYAVMCFAFGLMYRASHGLPGNWSQQALAYAQARNDKAFVRELDLSDPRVAEAPPQSLGSADPAPGSETFLLWGDSRGMALAPLLDHLGKQLGVKGVQITRSATAPVIGWKGIPPWEAQRWAAAAFEAAEKAGVSAVFLVGRWEAYGRSPDLKARLQETVDAFTQRGIKVYLVLDVVTQKYDVPRILALTDRYPWFERWRPRHDVASYLSQNLTVKSRVLPNSPELTALDPSPLLSSGSTSLESIDGVALYRDPGHLSARGSLSLSPLLEPIFAQLSRGEVSDRSRKKATGL